LAAGIVLACSERESSDDDYSAVVKFDTATVRIVTSTDTTRVHVEIAKSREQRTMGLMERTSLPDSAGMLFLFDRIEPETSGFWMFRTRIPLDIAFLDSTGRIVSIRQMQPCAATLISGCPSYESGVPYRAALEVNAGYFARRAITPGARLDLPAANR
jgi:uncharacterized protein